MIKPFKYYNTKVPHTIIDYCQDCQVLEQEVEEKEEKFSKLEIEHKKGLNAIQGLRSYIRFAILWLRLTFHRSVVIQYPGTSGRS